MNYLLDTHTFIWMDSKSPDLSERARLLIADLEHVLFLSLASVWEMQIKAQLGKLNLRVALPDILRDQQITNDIQLLSITLDHILELKNLPDHHKDPFDRLLVAQSNIEQMPIISRDTQIAKYPVNVIW